MSRGRMGVVTGGTFTKGLSVRLEGRTSSEALQIGGFCVVEGQEYLYFSMIQDLALQTTDVALMSTPPNLSPFMLDALRGTSMYVVAEIKPMLMVQRLGEDELEDGEAKGFPQPVRTIPMHFAELFEASDVDYATVFGSDKGVGKFFAMGYPLTSDMPIPINLGRLVERSSGIFGSTGTGKSFLTRILLGGIISRDIAVNLIFDMHNEYAYGKESEEGDRVKGLKELFGPKIKVYTLDPKNRSVRADHDLAIRLDDIQKDDVLSLSGELGLPSGTTDTNLDILERQLGRKWLRLFLDKDPDELAEFAEEVGGHRGSLQALHRKLRRLKSREYIHEHIESDVFKQMTGYLDKGKHVILHFGKNDDVLDQMIVANMVTRRIRQLYQDKAEKYQETQRKADKPRPLVITLEEAHRFLNPEMARQTIFGTIARELRKYYVTLLIVDQRPSGIDNEILSQVGTRISGKLLDERDLEAVLSGVSNRSAIRAGLASLDTKQQIMIFGHAIPMPIALRTRRYDNQFYQDVTRSAISTTDLYSSNDSTKKPKRALDNDPPRSSESESFESEIDLLFGG